MGKKYLLIFIVVSFTFVKGFSQNCTSLGCAKDAAGTYVAATNISGVTEPGTCFPIPYKQAYWQFFYSPTGGVYTQTYTPILTGDPLDLDYLVFDLGMTGGPASISCPVNTSGFTEILCRTAASPNQAIGPGTDATLNTIAGHFYAIAIYVYQELDLTYSFTIGNPQIGGVNLVALNCQIVLPVKLSSFNAKVNSCNVSLDWVAETESQLKNYEVEFSTDGRRFQSLATVSTQGAGSNKKYTYQHMNPMQGRIFYRLKMTDMDGRTEYSKIIALNLDCNQSKVLVYPNPVTDLLQVNITNVQFNSTTASLFDSNGKLIYYASMISGTNEIDMSKFIRGVYVLQLKNNQGIENLKIIK